MTEPYPWVPTVRRHKEHFWKDVSNQRNFLDETARALGIKEVFCYVQVKSQLVISTSYQIGIGYQEKK